MHYSESCLIRVAHVLIVRCFNAFPRIASDPERKQLSRDRSLMKLSSGRAKNHLVAFFYERRMRIDFSQRTRDSVDPEYRDLFTVFVRVHAGFDCHAAGIECLAGGTAVRRQNRSVRQSGTNRCGSDCRGGCACLRAAHEPFAPRQVAARGGGQCRSCAGQASRRPRS